MKEKCGLQKMHIKAKFTVITGTAFRLPKSPTKNKLHKHRISYAWRVMIFVWCFCTLRTCPSDMGPRRTL